MLTPKDKEDIKEIVVDVVKDLIIPAIEVVSNKTDQVDQRIEIVENRLEQVDRKLDRVAANVIEHEQKLQTPHQS